MKKSVMALICLISVVFFASCKKDKNVENPKPSISIVEGESFVADGDTINWGQTVRFGFRMASSSETHKDLRSLIVTVDETEQANIVFPNGTDVYVYLDSVNFRTSRKIDFGKHVISATVTDVDGKTATAALTLNNSVVEDTRPSISVFGGDGFVADGDTVTLNHTVKFGFKMTSSPETHKALKSLIVKVGEMEWTNITFPNTTDVYVYLDSIDYGIKSEIEYVKDIISATVTDVDGESASASITLNIHVVEDPRPSISVIEAFGFVADGDTVNFGQSAKFGFKMFSNNETQSELKSLTLWINDEPLAEINLSDNSYSYVDSVYFEIGKEIIGEAVIKATVSDADGYRATASITLYINFDDPQLVETDFIWERRGAAYATGLEEFGLEWTANYKDICAQIKPMDGYSLYEFSPEIWSTITTENEKAYFFLTAVENIPSISVFNKVSIMDSHDNLDFVIGTINQETGETHLLHITSCVVEAANYGLMITITGQAK